MSTMKVLIIDLEIKYIIIYYIHFKKKAMLSKIITRFNKQFRKLWSTLSLINFRTEKYYLSLYFYLYKAIIMGRYII